MEKTGVETSTGAVDEKVAVVVEQQPLLAGEEKIRKVMVGVDDSDGSFYALKWTLDHFFFNLPGPADVPAADDKEEHQPSYSMIILVNVQQPLFQPFIHPAGPGTYVRIIN